MEDLVYGRFFGKYTENPTHAQTSFATGPFSQEGGLESRLAIALSSVSTPNLHQELHRGNAC